METCLNNESFLAKHISTGQNDMLYAPTEELAGWPGVVHGGLQMLALNHLVEDHLSGLTDTIYRSDKQRIVIRYHQPVRTNQTYKLHVSEIDFQHGEVNLNSSIRDARGVKLTQAVFCQNSDTNQYQPTTQSKEFSDEDMLVSWSRISQWPVWQTCCLNPVQQHMGIHVDWHMDPQNSFLAGRVIWPEAHGFFKPTAMALALMDQGLGYCGQRDGCSMLFTIRLEGEMRHTPKPGDEVVLVCQGKKRSSKTYNARARLLLGTSLVAQGTAMFRTY